jgi:hypothetical protein
MGKTMFSTKQSVLTFLKRGITETDLEGQAATARDAHNLLQLTANKAIIKALITDTYRCAIVGHASDLNCGRGVLYLPGFSDANSEEGDVPNHIIQLRCKFLIYAHICFLSGKSKISGKEGMTMVRQYLQRLTAICY